MDVLLLGAAAVVLLVLTIWIVWRPGSEAPATATEDAAPMMPQGDRFEDQYTSATADLSAGGVALAEAEAETERETDAQPVGEPRRADTEPGGVPPVAVTTETPWPLDTPSTEGVSTAFDPVPRKPADALARFEPGWQSIGIGAAALLLVAGALCGAWLYARWQREQNKPVNRLRRLRRRFR
jgi:hypothetical protein